MQTGVFREVLAADVAVELGIVSATEAADALARYWETHEEGILRDLSTEDRRRVESLVARLLDDADGNAETAVAQRGVAREIHAGMSPKSAHALADTGARIRSPLRAMDRKRYLGFMPLAEGGMGAVYLALDSELNRRVAFKMIRVGGGTTHPLSDDSGPVSDDLVARFMQEAVVTGGLEHPGIVPVYELGATPSGVPYYTMRLVRGERTLDDAISDATSMTERLTLLEPFLKVCDAIDYAHSRGVIHRDLKPANVALGEFGEVVVLDWGLAKLRTQPDFVGSRWQARLDELRQESDLETMTSALGTPGYMAPEAALGKVREVDERSDIYSLGVILYLILCGRFPFEFKTFPDYISRLNEGVTSVPDAPEGLARICMRAMATARDDRYPTVGGLADDLRSWQTESAVEREVEALLSEAEGTLEAAAGLAGNALLRQLDRAMAVGAHILELRADEPRARELRDRARARREEALEQRVTASRGKLLRRVGVVGLGVAAAATVVVAIVLDGQRREAEDARADEAAQRIVAEQERARAEHETRRAEKERERAEEERARAEDMAAFMLHDLHEGLEPVGRLDLLDTVARKSLDYYSTLPTENITAEVMFQRAVALARVGEVLHDAGELEKALDSCLEAQSILVQLLETDPENVAWREEFATTLNRTGDVQQEVAQMEAALASYQKSVDERRDLGAREPLTRSLQRVGNVLLRMGRRDEAVKAYQEALDIRRDLLFRNPDDPKLQQSLAVSIQKMGELALEVPDQRGALAEFERALVMWRKLVRLDPANLKHQVELGGCLFRIGHTHETVDDDAAAVAAFDEARAIYRKLVDRDPTHAWWQRNLAMTLERQASLLRESGDVDAAGDLFRRAHEIMQAMASRDPTNTRARHDVGDAVVNLGDLARSAKHFDKALEHYGEALAISRDLVAADPKNVEWKEDLHVALFRVAQVHQDMGASDKARDAYQEAFQVATELSSRDPAGATWQQNTAYCHDPLGDLAKADGDWETALDDYRAAVQIRRRLLQRDPDNQKMKWSLVWALGRLGEGTESSGDLPEALRLYQEALPAHRELLESNEAPERIRAFSLCLYNIGTTQASLGDPAGALRHLREAEWAHGYASGYESEHHFWTAAYRDAVLSAGAETPGDHLVAAYAAYESKEFDVSADHFASAFDDDALRADLARGNLYNAACSAALAGESDRALAWLTEDLRRRRESMEPDPLRAHLEHARINDPDLASIRGTDAFDALFE